MHYVALLRGINVGGNSTVEMKKLKDTCERIGLTDVRTYINSGNVLFTSNEKHQPTLCTQLEQAIEKDFGFFVSVLLRTSEQIHAVVEALPTNWVNDNTMKCDVMFLWEEVDHPAILEQLPITKGLDDVRYIPGAVLWKVDRENVTKSKLSKLVGTKLYKAMTIRNCNTVRKIQEMMQ